MRADILICPRCRGRAWIVFLDHQDHGTAMTAHRCAACGGAADHSTPAIAGTIEIPEEEPAHGA